jgi:formylglycine-generating enzyme required for sulfatase activity
MARTETTNSQYVAFLNNSEAGKTNLLGVFSGSSAGNAAYRIQQSGTFGNYTYSLKSADSGDKPVNFVSWWSAARFANWLSNGADVAASTETGSYTLNGLTSGPLVGRNAGAIYYLPSADEWTKAAYYNATANNYYRFASVSSTNAALNGTLPAAGNLSTDPTAFAATWNAVSAGVTPVGYFSTVTSPYGMYDMVGNVNEMTDTAQGSTYALFSGSYASTQVQIELFDSLTAPSFVNGTTENAPRGFRIAAVPEPSTLVLASIGLMVGLVGCSGWLKRRTVG